jgi:hypothetical protein
VHQAASARWSSVFIRPRLTPGDHRWSIYIYRE